MVGQARRAIEQESRAIPGRGDILEHGGGRAGAAAERGSLGGVSALEPQPATRFHAEPAQTPEAGQVSGLESLAVRFAEPGEGPERLARLVVVEGVQGQLREPVPQGQRQRHAGTATASRRPAPPPSAPGRGAASSTHRPARH